MKIEEKQIPDLIREGKDRVVIPVLYKAVFPKVKNYITKNNGQQEDAYDVFQDAVFLFYRQIIEKTFNDKYTVYGYLYRLSINRWINKLRKDKRISFTESLDEDDSRVSYTDTEADPWRNNEEQTNILSTLFADIGDKCIEILTLVIYHNLLMEDIMIRTGLVSEGAVKMKLKRCKEKLYKEIEKNPVLLDKLKGNG